MPEEETEEMQDLSEEDFFLPEDARGELDLSGPVNRVAAGTVFVIGTAACVLMVLGAGGPLTWFGGVLFWIFLTLFTLISNRGIDQQNEEIDELLSGK